MIKKIVLIIMIIATITTGCNKTKEYGIETEK